MFERFTDRARRVVVLAQEEARMLNHNYVGPEHVLLGLIHEGQGVAVRALTDLGLGLDEVRQHVEELIGQGEQAPSGHIPFTPRAKRVLELSLREALQLGHNYIGTEHILLGILREGENVGAQAHRGELRLPADRGTQLPGGHGRPADRHRTPPRHDGRYRGGRRLAGRQAGRGSCRPAGCPAGRRAEWRAG
jgi:ATP-dependent Clp protease ATP-binding subunit ClpA